MANEEGKEPSPSPSRAEALRAAVDQAFGATERQARSTRDRAADIADELASAAGRVRELLDDLRPPSTPEVRTLQERMEALEARVSELEQRRG